MSWWPAIVLFGSLLFPLGEWLHWSGRDQLGPYGPITLAIPVLGVVWVNILLLFSLRSPFAGPWQVGVTAVGLVTLLVVTGLLIPHTGRAGATAVLIPSVPGLLVCALLISLGALDDDPLLTALGVGGLLGLVGLSVLCLTGDPLAESVANITLGIDRRTKLSLLLVAVLVPATLVMHVPSALSSTLCDRPGEYDVEDVRISYDRSTMIGSFGVYVHGREVYSVDRPSASDSPVYRVGTVSTETIRRLMSVVERNGVLCLNDRYTGIVTLTEPTSETLHIATETESKRIAVSPESADAPPQIDRTTGVLWETGRAQPRVNASRFCSRLPADADTKLTERCRSLSVTDTVEQLI